MWCIIRMDTTTAWKKLSFLLSDSSDFHMTDNLSIVVHAFASRVLMSFSEDLTLLPRQVNLSTSFREPPFIIEMSPLWFWLKHMYSILSALIWRTMSPAALFQTIQLEFSWGMCICQKCYVICVVRRISSAYCLFRYKTIFFH